MAESNLKIEEQLPIAIRAVLDQKSQIKSRVSIEESLIEVKKILESHGINEKTFSDATKNRRRKRNWAEKPETFEMFSKRLTRMACVGLKDYFFFKNLNRNNILTHEQIRDLMQTHPKFRRVKLETLLASKGITRENFVKPQKVSLGSNAQVQTLDFDGYLSELNDKIDKPNQKNNSVFYSPSKEYAYLNPEEAKANIKQDLTLLATGLGIGSEILTSGVKNLLLDTKNISLSGESNSIDMVVEAFYAKLMGKDASQAVEESDKKKTMNLDENGLEEQEQDEPDEPENESNEPENESDSELEREPENNGSEMTDEDKQNKEMFGIEGNTHEEIAAGMEEINAMGLSEMSMQMTPTSVDSEQ